MDNAARSPIRLITRRPVRSDVRVTRPSVAHRSRRAEVDAQAAVRLTERLLSEAREELRRADAKATQSLTMFGGLSLALLTVLVGASWSPRELSGVAAWTWWSGCACAAVALFAFAMALLPRTTGSPELRHVAYFGHVHRLRDPATVRRYVEQAAKDSMPGLISQLCWISRLVMTKYRWTRTGTLFATLAAGLAAVSLL